MAYSLDTSQLRATIAATTRLYTVVPPGAPRDSNYISINPPSPGVSGVVTYATNNSTSDEVYEERSDYRDFVFPADLISNSVDMWQGEERYYGRVDTQGNALVSQEPNLKQVRYAADDETLFVLDFVADAWRDFAEKLRNLAEDNIMIKDSVWAAPLAYKGWESVANQYQEYLTTSVYETLSNIFLVDNPSLNPQITGMQSFLDIMGQYYHNVVSKGAPLTLSGFVEGPFVSPMVTGLCIEIGTDEYFDDATKASKYINDPAFMFVAEIASQYGFSLDRNIPWRLVADITNPAMREYMVGVPLITEEPDNKNLLDNCDNPMITGLADLPGVYGYSQIPGLLSVVRHATGYTNYQNILTANSTEGYYSALYAGAYQKTYLNDMDILKVYLLDFYNRYVTENPYTSTFDTRSGICDPDRTDSIVREYVTEEEFFALNSSFGNRWLLNLFYNLRLSERSIRRDERLKEQQINKIMMIYQHVTGNTDVKYLQSLHYMQENMIGPFGAPPLTFAGTAATMADERPGFSTAGLRTVQVSDEALAAAQSLITVGTLGNYTY